MKNFEVKTDSVNNIPINYGNRFTTKTIEPYQVKSPRRLEPGERIESFNIPENAVRLIIYADAIDAIQISTDDFVSYYTLIIDTPEAFDVADLENLKIRNVSSSPVFIHFRFVLL